AESDQTQSEKLDHCDSSWPVRWSVGRGESEDEKPFIIDGQGLPRIGATAHSLLFRDLRIFAFATAVVRKLSSSSCKASRSNNEKKSLMEGTWPILIGTELQRLWRP
ncbi:hypothetical protein FOZ63_024899, partial [Perkinsus olseni]